MFKPDEFGSTRNDWARHQSRAGRLDDTTAKRVRVNAVTGNAAYAIGRRRVPPSPPPIVQLGTAESNTAGSAHARNYFVRAVFLRLDSAAAAAAADGLRAPRPDFSETVFPAPPLFFAVSENGFALNPRVNTRPSARRRARQLRVERVIVRASFSPADAVPATKTTITCRTTRSRLRFGVHAGRAGVPDRSSGFKFKIEKSNEKHRWPTWLLTF